MGLHRECRQVQVTRVQRAQRDAGVATDQLELVGPAFPVESRPHQRQGPVRRGAGSCVAQQCADRPQGHGHAGQPDVQRTVRPRVGLGRDASRAAQSGIGVPIVTEVTMAFQQRQHDARSAAVERRIGLLVGRGTRPLQPGPGHPGRPEQPVGRRARHLFGTSRVHDRQPLTPGPGDRSHEGS
jgi:hypothetical protein